ncbi:hypothetical protein RPMA_18360 [Tardiphaga alba]|uniref:Head-to-tail connector protein n=1 Tax=Tardiphaga alba TaxID=340268 RepID=A0ABX8ABH3_9BRAD|nr:hypothetical protein [Tardiphaga alba]QUS40582.1 hypothetical protein RPMA_18360 [Tardiphaga alba]
MAEREYDVMRLHEGDKIYVEGDVRTISEADAQHLVALGVLVPREAKAAPAEKPADEPAQKAETERMNKAEPAPANKAEKPRGKGK